MSDFVNEFRLRGGLTKDSLPAAEILTAELAQARQYELCHSEAGSETRPAFHISPPCGWLNDPNGLSFFQGKYHQFFQYYPYAPKWGPMHWGHAVSNDLIKWEYLPCAIAPDQPFDASGCYSGTAIALTDSDHLLMYTGVRAETEADGTIKKYQTQCLALGDGINYEKLPINPVISAQHLPEGCSPRAFRDPKIWKYQDKFYAVAVHKDQHQHGVVSLFSSPNLIDWTWINTVDSSQDLWGEMWECPDIFTLDGQDLMLISAQGLATRSNEFHNGHEVICLSGKFDSETGIFQRKAVLPVDQGIDFYAPQTILTPDGRRVMIGWLQSWESSKFLPPGQNWIGTLSLPRELSYRDGNLYQNPVTELCNYRSTTVKHENVLVTNRIQLAGVSGRMLDLTVKVRPTHAGSYQQFSIDFCHDDQYRTHLRYDPVQGILTLDRFASGFPFNVAHVRSINVDSHNTAEIKLRLILDRWSVEAFVNDGRHTMSATIYTPLSAEQISFDIHGEAIIDIENYQLKI